MGLLVCIHHGTHMQRHGIYGHLSTHTCITSLGIVTGPLGIAMGPLGIAMGAMGPLGSAMGPLIFILHGTPRQRHGVIIGGWGFSPGCLGCSGC